MAKFKYFKQLIKFSGKNIILFTLTCLLTITPSTFAKQVEKSPFLNKTQIIQSPATNPEQLLEQGEILYQKGDLKSAIAVLQQALNIYQETNNNLGQAAALTNLSLVYQQLGAGKEANAAIQDSLKLLGWDSQTQTLNVNSPKSELLKILARTLDIQAGLLLKQGKPDNSWQLSEQSEQIWQKLGNNFGIIRSRINQAQALRVSGYYRRSLSILEQISKNLEAQPPSPVKVVALRSLGNTHQQLGDLRKSEIFLQESLRIATKLKLTQEIALTEFSLGNTARSLSRNNKNKLIEAINHYQNAAKFASNSLTKVQAQINQFNLLIDNKNEQALTEAKKLIPIIQSQLGNLPVNQSSIYAKINFARTLIDSQSENNIENQIGNKQDIVQILVKSVKQARSIGNERAESYALGSLGKLYEINKRFPDARKLTTDALVLAQRNQASDTAYLWEWQLGRLFKAEGNITAAVSSYDSAVIILNSLRTDLAAVNREAQFNFRDRIEPIYRESVELLLQEKGQAKPDLDKVRKRIEALQLAELDNYFREACLNNEFVALDEVVDEDNPETAIFYPIILDNKLEIILKLPGEKLIRKNSKINSQELEELIKQIQNNIVRPDRVKKFETASLRLYQLLIQPIASELKNSPVKTLVFIPDGSLRNIPMAALYDGKEYLMQKYAIAISPGLQLFTPKALTRQQLNALAGGLSEIPENEKNNFAPLPNVEQELESILKSGVSGTKLYNDQFTEDSLEQNINNQPFQVVHFATHGQFSSNPEETFILANDKRIKVAELDSLLESREQKRTEPIELLVLSACQTATGDKRAALGLAGVALSAGARSTLASLWSIGDDSTAYFINEFYTELMKGEQTTAEALRKAQSKLLSNPEYNRPMFWAPYVLVGNWL